MAYQDTLQYLEEARASSKDPMINLEIKGHDHMLANGTRIAIRAGERMYFHDGWRVKVEINAIEKDADMWFHSESYWIPLRGRSQTSMRRSNLIAAIERANMPKPVDYESGW